MASTSPHSNSCSCCCSLKRQLGLETLRRLHKGRQSLVLLCRDAPRHILLACKVIPSAHHHICSAQQSILQNTQQSIGSRKRKLRDTQVSEFPHDLQHQVSSRKRELSAEELSQDAQLRWEAEVLRHLNGVPGILPLVSVEGDDCCFHLLTPFCDAGNLLGKLDSHPPHFKLDDHEAAPIVASLARTLVACHSRGIVHRDVNPGNILLRQAEDGGHEDVFLADFGLAAIIAPGEILRDRVGTPQYQAPEVIESNYDHRADAWSLGVVLHLLLTSTLPFIEHFPHDTPTSAIRHAILCNKLELDAFGLSPSAQDLLQGILCKDPDSRLTLDEVLSHPWLVFNTHPMINVNRQHGVSQSDFVDDGVPKITRKVGVHMSRKSYRQHCSDILARATTHPACSAAGPLPSLPGIPTQPVVHGSTDHKDVDENTKVTPRVHKPMDRKFYRQLWVNAIAHPTQTITGPGCMC